MLLVLLLFLLLLHEKCNSFCDFQNNRRIVMGLREVTKHLKLNQLKCIIISPNMERIQSKGPFEFS